MSDTNKNHLFRSDLLENFFEKFRELYRGSSELPEGELAAVNADLLQELYRNVVYLTDNRVALSIGIHHHEHGESHYLMESVDRVDEEQFRLILQEDFEPEHGESLEIVHNMDIVTFYPEATMAEGEMLTKEQLEQIGYCFSDTSWSFGDEHNWCESEDQAVISAHVNALIRFEDDLHVCDNCRRLHTTDMLKDIKNYSMRVDVGGEVPSGECMDCGCLCYKFD